MKKYLYLFVFLSLITKSFSQVPQSFKFQAIVRNSQNEIVADQDVRLQVKIIPDNSGNTPVYTEEHLCTTNTFGAVNLNIGQGTGAIGIFSAIDWSSGIYFIGLGLDLTGGTDFTPLGTTQLLSVPYALFSQNSAATQNGWINSGNNIYFNTGNVGIGTNDPASKLEVKADPLTPLDDALFVVKNQQGDSVFAVFNNSVVVYVDNTAKSTNKGMIVRKESNNKLGEEEYFHVTPDSTRIYTKDPQKGFGVGDLSTQTANSYLHLNPINSFIGLNSGTNIVPSPPSSGCGNVFIGNNTGLQTTNATGNVFLGDHAGESNISGSNNIYIGNHTGNLSNGSGNVFMGWNSGYLNQTGNDNVFIGEASGENNTGSGNVFIGNHSGFDNVNESNKFIVSNNDAIDPYIYGDFASNTLKMANGFIGDVGYGSAVMCLSHRQSATTTGFALVQDNTGMKTTLNIAPGTGWLSFSVGANIQAFMYNTGYFGFGLNAYTQPPTQRIDVNGSARFRGLSPTVTSALYVLPDGTLTLSVSDERLKANIQSLENSLDKVLKLQPKTYFYKNDDSKTQKIGFIAQDMEKVFPQFVFTNRTDGFKGINYAEITAVLTKAIQEQQSQIDAQKSQIDFLIKEVNDLKKQLNQLKN